MAPPEDSACLDEDTLAALVAGGLESSAIRIVEAHLAGCDDCRGLVADAASGAVDPGLDPALSVVETSLVPGSTVADKYRIEAPLGRGGMGVVLSARHIELGHRVAIKVLHSRDRTAAPRFLREAKTCAQLVNDHIARVFDLGRLPNGVPYFVMEHLTGEDLGAKMARGRVPPELAIEYVLQACAALEDAHAAGVIHRDLKPQNLFIVQRADGKPWLKVLDFGISKFMTGSSLGISKALTLSRSIVGSPHYMSPEQVHGSTGLDARSDIWSLGVIFYELLTGRRPFTGPTLGAVLVSIATEIPARPSSIVSNLPVGLEEVVLRCLEKDPAARFSSVSDLVAALCRVKEPLPDAPVESAPPQSRRRRRRVLSLVGLASLGISISTWLWLGRGSLGAADPITDEPAPKPEAKGQPLPPGAAPPRVAVRCDKPLPTASVHVSTAGAATGGLPWQRTLPVDWLCDAESSDDRRGELLYAVRDAPTSITAALDPPHPFYSIDWQRRPEELSVQLTRASHARVAVELTGPYCTEITKVAIRTEGGLAPVVAARDEDRPRPCQWHVDLPVDAFGKRHVCSFEPPAYSASEVTFESARLAVQVLKTAKSVTRKQPKPCLPPHYCRD